jgi:hypothetical protein
MGITVHYRGSLDDLARVEDFEDRVLDLALELGAHAQIWRSTCEGNPARIVRGIILDLYPGQETTSLLIAPEGWLINLIDIENAETGQLREQPSCSVKTQFGPIEGHVALIELLAAIKKQFIPNLEVNDEANYWDNRDLVGLRAIFGQVQGALDNLYDCLRRHTLSSEAAESNEIVVNHIQRVARVVQQTLARPSEHPPVQFDDDEGDFASGLHANEALWDAQFKENRRKQERLQRAIEERRGRGEDPEGAFEAALRDEGIIDLPEEPWPDDDDGSDADSELEDNADWRESLVEPLGDEQSADEQELCGDENDPFNRSDRHPLLGRVMDLLMQIHDLFKNQKVRSSHHYVLERGAGELMGGLAQALGSAREAAGELDFKSGWDLVQLKRALRGAAFALGSLCPLRAEDAIDDRAFAELRGTIKSIESDTFTELRRLREAREEK